MRSTKIKKTFAVLVYGHVYTIMVILRSQNKITDFLMILAWVWAFNGYGNMALLPHCQLDIVEFRKLLRHRRFLVLVSVRIVFTIVLAGMCKKHAGW